MSIATTNSAKTMALTTGKKIVASVAALLLTVTGVVATTTLTASAATFGVVEDAVLAACVNESINFEYPSTRSPTDEITQADMESLTYPIHCYGPFGGASEQVSDLTGLEYAINTTAIFVTYGNVTDLTPISGLTNLLEISFSGNLNLVDISSLENLTNLRGVDLSFTSVSDITPLTTKTLLTSVNLSSTSVSDITPLANKTNLTHFTLSSAAVSDLTPVSSMTSLVNLQLGSLPTTDISPLAGLADLDSLSLTNMEINDYTILETLPSLRWLNLSDSSSSGISSLSSLTNLERVFLGGMELEDLSFMSAWTNLEFANINGNWVKDISPIADTATVEALSLLPRVPLLTVSATTDPTFTSVAPQIIDHQGNLVAPTITPSEIIASYDSTTNTVTWNKAELMASVGAFYTFDNGANFNGSFWQGLDIPYMGIADPVLAACINAQIASDTGTTRLPDEAITQAELEAVYYLPCNGTFGNKIESVEGLQFATNLNYLYLGTNSITDVTPLADLNLVELGLRANPDLTSIDALNGMSTLTRLELSDTGITSIDALQNNTGMQWLELSRTNVSDLSAISQFTGLEFLSIAETQTTDLSFLTGLPLLNHLVTGDDSVTDYNPIASLPALRALSINGINTNDLSFLTPITTLEDLSLNQSTLVDLTPLAGLTNLTNLSVMQNEIVDLTPISDLANLNSLSINRNNVSDLTPLSGLTSLGAVYANNNAISDISMVPSTATVFALDQIVDGGIITTPETGSTFTTDGIPVKDAEGNNIIPTGAHIVSYDATANEILWDADALRNETATAYDFVSDDTNFAGTVNLTVEHDVFVAVNIPDDVLREALNARLATQTSVTRLPDAAISETEMKTITTFIYSGQGIPAQQITDLTGMETATNLTHLNLLWNDIVDVAPLAGLTLLEVVNVGDNQNLTNVDVFADDANLKTLFVGYTSVSDLDAFSVTTSLEVLDISGTPISDINFTSSLPNLDLLSMQGTEVASLDALEDNLSITQLFFGNDNITDFSPVSTMLNLTALAIVDSTVEDLTFVEPLTDLAWLTLMNNNISDVSPLAGLSNLSTVNIAINQVGDLSPVAGVSSVNASNQTVTGGTLTVPHTVATFTTTGTLVDELGENVTPAEGDIASYNAATNTITWDAVALRSKTVATYNFASSGTYSGTMTHALNIVAAPVNEITDVNLAACINTALGERGATDVITQADLATLTSLNCVGDSSIPAEQITDLAGMEYATNLTSLNLTNNNVTDLTPISGLSNLATISFSGNADLSDLAPLTGTTAFTSINLMGTSVSDLTPLSGNTGTTFLAVGNTNVSDLTTVSALTSLNMLDIKNTPVTDLTPIETLVSLDSLDISGTSVTDFAPIGNLVGLEVLNASNSGLTSIDFLENLTALQDLDVSDNNIHDLAVLAGLTVSFLILDNNEVIDLSPAGSVSTVMASGQVFNAGTLTVPHTVTTFTTTGIVFDADGNPIAPVGDEITSYNSTTNTITWDAVALREATSTSYSFSDGASFTGQVAYNVAVTAAPVTVIPDTVLNDCVNVALGNPSGTPILTAELAALTALVCANSGITNLAGLEQATGLLNLNLLGNDVTNIDPISGLTNLQILNLSENPNFSDLTPFAGSTWLTSVYLGGTNVSDISALSGNVGLLGLVLDGSQVSDLDDIASFVSLELLSINNTSIIDLTPIAVITSLTHLEIDDTSVTDFSPIESLVNLTNFAASRSGLTDISILESLTSLSFVIINSNGISDVTPLEGLTGLTYVSVSGNNIVDLSPIVDSTPLVAAAAQAFNAGTLTVPHTVATFTTTGIVFDVEGNPVAPTHDAIESYDSTTNTITWDAVALRSETTVVVNFTDGVEFSGEITYTVNAVTVPIVTVTDSALADCINVALGNPAGTPITTVGMASLTSLVCVDSDIIDLTGLEQAVNLETVDFSGNADLVDITPLTGLPLTDINLNGTDVTDLTPIAGIVTLTDLDVSNTGISSTVEIEAIASLVNLTANNNLLADVSGLASMPVLASVAVNGNQISDLSSFDGTSISVTASGQTLVGTQVVSGAGSEFTYETAITVLNVDGVTPSYSGTIPVVYDSATNILSWVSADLSGLAEIAYVFNDSNGFSGTVTSPIAFASVVDTTVTLPINIPVNVPIETDPEFVPVDYVVDGDLPDGITVNTDGEIVGTATENTETTVTIIITDAAGNVIEQEIIIVTGTGIVDTLTAPDAPTVVLNADGDVDVSWDVVTPDVADGTVASYSVSYTNAAGTTTTITDVIGTSYTLTNALSAGTYDFTVSYVTTTGSSSIESASTELVITAAVVDEEEEETSVVGLDKLPWTGAQISVALIVLAFLLVMGGILMIARTRSAKLKNS